MGLEKIAEYKKRLGLTTEELSKRSCVPIGTLNKILSGATRDPKLETLKAIARVLGLSLNDFDDEEYSPSSVETIAAHLDGEDLTPEEQEEVKNFIKYVKSKRE